MLGFEKIELAQILLEKRALIVEDLKSTPDFPELSNEKRAKAPKENKSKL